MRTFLVVILILTTLLLACTSEPAPILQAGNDAASQTAATEVPAAQPPTEMQMAAATRPQPAPTATATPEPTPTTTPAPTATPTLPMATTPPTATLAAEPPILTPTPTSLPAPTTATTTTTSSKTALRVTVSTIPSNLPTYDRHDWKHWTDADGDCQDARQEVLVAESNGAVSFRTDRGCKVSSGQWLAPYTSTIVTDPGKLNNAHMVPLGNAHQSGAWNWSAVWSPGGAARRRCLALFSRPTWRVFPPGGSMIRSRPWAATAFRKARCRASAGTWISWWITFWDGLWTADPTPTCGWALSSRTSERGAGS